jgi:NAD(P)-dependent dehydrogenase (short-subunit alcohol dehydrogenase family)
MRVKDKVAIVTGAAQGIGQVYAETLAREGAKVVLADIKADAAEANAAAIRDAGGEALAVDCDIADRGSIDAAVAATVERFGGLDVLVNNAGIAGPTGGVEEIDPAEWEQAVDVNLNAQFYFARRAVPLLREARDGGSIIALSSVAGRLGYAYRTPYSATKWAVVGLTKSLAIELGPDNIRVNAIQPGIVKGPRIERVIAARAEQLGLSYEAMEQDYLAKISLRRMTTPEEVAATALFLCSPGGSGISGQAISVCGNVEVL